MVAKKGTTVSKKAPSKAAPLGRRLVRATDIGDLEGFKIDEDLLDDDEELDDEELDDDGVAVDEDELPSKAKKSKGNQRGLTDQDKIEAFRAGKRGFAEAREERGWPTSLYPELYSDWSCGWRVAQAEEQQGVGIAVHSIFPPDLRDIAALEKVYSDMWCEINAGRSSLTTARKSAPVLPWDMCSLRGTTWRNLHTGSATMVNERVIADGWGHPHLAQSRAASFTNERYPSPSGMGIWTDKAFVVEHYIPLLGWSPKDQLSWFAKEIAHHLDHVASAKTDAEDIARNPQNHSCASANYGMRISEMRSHSQRVREVRAQMEAFAQQHGLVITPELLNGTRFRRSTVQVARSNEPPRIEQMMLI